MVDDEDYEELSKYKWIYNNGYGARAARISDKNYYKGGLVMMHRQIMGFPENKEIDHINGIKSDNRKENLRICTRAENARNSKKRINSASKYKGLSKNGDSWQVFVWDGNKNIHIGIFKDEVEAAKAYDKAAREYYGEFAKLNFSHNPLPTNRDAE